MTDPYLVTITTSETLLRKFPGEPDENESDLVEVRIDEEAGVCEVEYTVLTHKDIRWGIKLSLLVGGDKIIHEDLISSVDVERAK